METIQLSSLNKFLDMLYGHLLAEGFNPQVIKADADYQPSYYDYSHQVRPNGDALTLICFASAMKTLEALEAPLDTATKELVQRIAQHYLTSSIDDEYIPAIQKEINAYLSDPANRSPDGTWFTYRAKPGTSRCFYLEGCIYKLSSDSVVNYNVLIDTSFLPAALHVSTLRFCMSRDGSRHVDAIRTIFDKATSASEFNFTPKCLSAHALAAALEFDFDGMPCAIVITPGCRDLILYTDLKDQDTQLSSISSNHKALVFEEYEEFKGFEAFKRFVRDYRNGKLRYG